MKAAVIGAGIMGQLLALKLLEKNWRVEIFERQASLENCSMAAAGMLTPFSELEKNPEVIFQMGMEALRRHWPEVLSRVDSTIYFQKRGSLLVSHSKDRAEMRRFVEMVGEKFSGGDFFRAVNSEQIMQLEPQLTHFERGCYFAEEGQIDNQALMQSLRKYLCGAGVKLHVAEVSLVKPGEISTQAGAEKFEYVFDCRGLAAKEVFSDLRGVRGELIWVHAPDVQQKSLVRLLHPRYSLYIVPRPNDIYILGASEIESEDYGPVSVRSTLELLSAAYYVNPAFAEARILKTVTHCRPTLADHLPRIQHQSGLIAVNGLYRHGFLLAPTLAEEVVNYLESGKNMQKYLSLWSNTL